MSQAFAEYDRAFPEIKHYGCRPQEATQNGRRELVTMSARYLPLDRDRLCGVTNHAVQSTARGVMNRAALDLFEANLGEHVLLAIHDEVLADAPADIAEDADRAIQVVMQGDIRGVPLTAGADVTDHNWGAAHGATCSAH